MPKVVGKWEEDLEERLENGEYHSTIAGTDEETLRLATLQQYLSNLQEFTPMAAYKRSFTYEDMWSVRRWNMPTLVISKEPRLLPVHSVKQN